MQQIPVEAADPTETLVLRVGRALAGNGGIRLASTISPRTGRRTRCVIGHHARESWRPGLPTISADIDGTVANGDILLFNPPGELVLLIRASGRDNVLVVTNRCNALCEMCPQVSRDHELQAEINAAALRLTSKRLPALALTGGEPTVALNDLIGLLRLCKRHLPRTRIELLTNAMRLSDARCVAAILGVGISDLWFEVPLHGDNPLLHDAIAGCPSFYRTMRGMYNLHASRASLEVRVVVSQLNYKRLTAIAAYVAMNVPFARHVAIMGLELEGRAALHGDRLWIAPREYAAALADAAAILDRSRMRMSIYNHPLCVLPEPIWRYARQSISGWKRRYPSACGGCAVREKCGGMFRSTEHLLEGELRPITGGG